MLTPEQRLKGPSDVEDRIVIAAAARSVADRMEAIADKLGLPPSSGSKSRKPTANSPQVPGPARRTPGAASGRVKAIAAILTPEQREKVKDFSADRIVYQVTATAPRGQSRQSPAGDDLRAAGGRGRQAGPDG